MHNRTVLRGKRDHRALEKFMQMFQKSTPIISYIKDCIEIQSVFAVTKSKMQSQMLSRISLILL